MSIGHVSTKCICDFVQRTGPNSGYYERHPRCPDHGDNSLWWNSAAQRKHQEAIDKEIAKHQTEIDRLNLWRNRFHLGVSGGNWSTR